MLKNLTEAFGVSGCEAQVRDAIYKEIKNFCDSIKIDSMGNLCAYKKARIKGGEPKRVLLSAHMDEVGLIVTEITDEGYLKFASVGGIDPKVLVSQRVVLNGKKGVIALKAVHLTTAEEREKPVSEKQLYIDMGARDKESAMRIAAKGDYCAFDSEYVEFGDYVKAKALDDRVGCAIMIEMLKKDWAVDLYCNFTVQEEVGLRGARIASKGINPDYAIVIEATTCNDLYGVEKHLWVTKSGGGPAISILDSASKADAGLVDMLKRTAEKHEIPHQYKAATTGGNDAGAIYVTDGGIKTASVSVPCRYIHSPVSAMHKDDFKNCRELIQCFLEDMGRGELQYD